MRIVNIKRVMHGSGGMMRGNVERLKIVIIILNFRALDDFETELGEKIGHTLYGARNGVMRTNFQSSARERDVERFSRQLLRNGLILEECLTLAN